MYSETSQVPSEPCGVTNSTTALGTSRSSIEVVRGIPFTVARAPIFCVAAGGSAASAARFATAELAKKSRTFTLNGSSECSMIFSRASTRWGIATTDRQSTRLNSSHTVIYTLSLHDALPICDGGIGKKIANLHAERQLGVFDDFLTREHPLGYRHHRSAEHTSELQSHSDLHSFPTRRSSDLRRRNWQKNREPSR